MTLRIGFAGTSDFALPSLVACVEHHDVVVVVTQPDKPGNRGSPAPRPVADLARERGIFVVQPERIRSAEAVEDILGYNIDVLMVASYGQIIPAVLLDAPKHGGINVHGSLLPRWRGASPVAAAILAGDEHTGVSIMRMDTGVDTGPVYATREREILPTDTTPSLLGALAEEGAELLLEVLGSIESGDARALPQNDDLATLAPLLKRGDGLVNWEQHTAAHIDRMVRALEPWPGTSAEFAGATVRLVSGYHEPADRGAEAGEVVAADKRSVGVQTASGVYHIERLQPQGKREMPATDFLRGRQ